MIQPEIDFAHYPGRPGYKVAGPSQEAANELKTDAVHLRNECLTLLRTRDLTADETADILGKSVLYVRPRFTELFKRGEAFKTDVRRKNKSGLSATVWTVKKPQLKTA